MKKPELLIPAGSLEDLKAAIDYGADAVYFGGARFSLRAKIRNLTREEMREGAEYAHERGAKAYVTVNIAARNEDLDDISTFLKDLARVGIDAVIVWDPGVILLAQDIVPSIDIHLSTQANTLNWSSVLYWQRAGIKRVNLARELSLREILEIRNRTDLELEIFVHGAICIAYSGRCVLSNYLANLDTHKGLCATPCRWKYYLIPEKKPEEPLPILEDGKATYILNSRDLCLIEYIPQLVQLGVDSFKIEGRQRGLHYVSTVTRIYREAIDAYFSAPESYKFNPIWLDELRRLSSRGYTTGFYFRKPQADDHSYWVR